MSPRHPAAPLIETLEPRILYSADLMPVAGSDPLVAEQQTLNQPAPLGATTSLLIVDGRIDGYQKLIDDFSTQAANSGQQLEVVVIGADEDGIARISETLAGRQDIAAIHLLTHGESGVISLGNTRLDSDTLFARAPEVAGWGTAMTADGDLLVYGCNVAEGSAGQLFINQLAALTGADVAATDNLTGNASQGGDWTLEYRVGTISGALTPTSWPESAWQGVLATYTVTNTNDSGAGSLRQAITNANANAGVDSINFNIPGTGVHTITLSSLLPSISDAVILDASTDDSFAANGNKPAVTLNGNSLLTNGLVLTSTADGSTIRGLVIKNFKNSDIFIQSGSSGNTIAGNYLGALDTSGNYDASVANITYVMEIDGDNNIIGGTTAADRNVITSSSANYGIFVYGAGAFNNRITGNYFGTDATGNTGIGAGFTGVSLYSCGANNQIGGSATNAGNVFSSGTISLPIYLYGAGSGSLIQGNRIGVSASGSLLSGIDTGIRVDIGNNASILDNWIGGATNYGIRVFSGVSGTIIQGNRIGTDLAGTANWGSQWHGIYVQGNNSLIGGTGPGQGNIVANSNQAGSTYDGICVTGGTGNTILANSIYGTKAATGALGIDLGSDGITSNDTGDADTGANNLQNFPILTLAKTNGSNITITGTLNSTASNYFRIEFFANSTANGSGNGEGKTYLGYVDVATNASGNASFSTTLSAAVPVGYAISATATKSDATYSTFTDTSEFTRDIIGISATQGQLVVDTASDNSDGDTTSISTLLANKGADGYISLREAIAAANNTANGTSADSISFAIAGTGVHIITLGSALPTITDSVILDASTDDSFAANGNKPAVIIDGNGLTTDGLRLSSTADGSTIRGLVVRNFNGDGIQIDAGSDGNTIAGNYIGKLSAAGISGGTGSTGAGIAVYGANNIIGGSTNAERNVISGNANGIIVDAGSGNTITGNYIGTDATGNTVVANTFDGVRLQNGATANTIGGSSASLRNIISGNGEEGIQIDGESSDGNIIRGNWIGIGANGSTLLGTSGDGIFVSGGADNTLIGGPGATDGNWIAGAVHVGIEVDGSSNGTLIQGNRIGTDQVGTANWGTQQDGILIEDFFNVSGPTNTLIADNIIAFSGQGGVYTRGIVYYNTAGTGNAMLRNQIYGSADIGIDLGANGVTANDTGDADTGANNLQNFPVLTLAKTDGTSQITIAGTLNSTASSYYRIELFANPTADSSGYGEGQIYLGFVNVATDISGNASFSTTLNATVPVGYAISATATKSDATYSTFTDTSEFARDIVAISATQGQLVVDTASDTSDGDTTSISTLLANKGADGFISLREAITAANNTANGSSADSISFAIAGTGVHTINLASTLPTITDSVIIDASTEDSFTANTNRPAIVLDGNNGNYTGLVLAADGSTIRGFLITNFQKNGITINAGADGNTIVGNYFGQLTSSGTLGTTTLGAQGLYIEGSNNIIGSGNTADRNLFAGIAGNVITINKEAADGNIIQGNWIGLAADGATVLGTNGYGIQIGSGGDNTLIGGSTLGQGNVIVGSASLAISIDGDSSGTVIRGNYLGTDSTLTVSGGNDQNINLSTGAHDNMIGGTGANDGNYVTNGTWSGIYLWPGSGTGNAFLGNHLWNNAKVGINLSGGTENSAGVTANDTGDADTGANNLQNFPVLTMAKTDGTSQITIAGTLNSTASSYYRIELFANPTADSSGYGEGQIYLGYVNVATDGSGNASFSTTLSAAIPVGYAISATATKSDATYSTFTDTSEFAASLAAGSGAPVNTVPGAQSVNEDTVLAISGLSVASQGTLTLTVGLSVLNGTLNVNLAGGATINAGANGTAALTLTGSIAQVNAALATLTYQGTANYNGSDTLSVSSTDQSTLTANSSVSITILAVNDAPTISNGASVVLSSTDENTTSSPTLVSSLLTSAGWADADTGALKGIAITGAVGNGSWQYSTNGITWTAFGSVSATNALLLADSSQIRYTPDGNNGEIATFDFKAWDRTTGSGSLNGAPSYANPGSGGGSAAYSSELASASLTVTAVNDAPIITSNGGASTASVNVAENSTAVTTVTATDADLPAQTLTYSIIGGADAAQFSIDSSTGALSFLVAPDFEVPTDSGGNNVYDVVVQVSDGSLTSSQAIAVTVTNTNDNVVGPISDTNAAANTLAENAANGATVGITAYATDSDVGDTITYSLDNDAGGRFTIDANTGVVTVANGSLLDYEAATSHGITVLASSADGSSSSQAFTITLTDVNEFAISPVSDSNAAANSVAENAANGTVVGVTAFASDADGTTNTVTYSLSNDAGGRFAIDANTGVVTVANGSLLDYEAATSHGITVLASSADGSSSSQAFTINLTPVNDNAPIITSNGGAATASVNVAENSTAVTTVTATDADLPAQPLTYSIIGGADAAQFSIDSSTGALSFLVAPDFEVPTDSGGNNVYDVVVQVSDGSLTSLQAISVSVFNSNEAPTNSPLSLTSIAEDSGPRLITQPELLANAADVDGPSLSAIGLTITAGNGSLVDNGNGTWTYTPTLNDNGSVSFAYTVTDGSLGVAGSATLLIAPVNDAPTINAGSLLTLPGTNHVTTSGATSVDSLLSSAAWADVDGGALKGVAIVGSSGLGTWQYSMDGSTWTAFGNVSGSHALLLADSSQVRYVPDGVSGEVASFSYQAWDQTAGIASGNGTPHYASAGSGGGSSAYSAQQAGTSLTVTLSGSIQPITPPPPTIPIVPLPPVTPVTPTSPTTGTTQPGTGSTAAQQSLSTALPAIGDLFFTPGQPTGAGHFALAGIMAGQDPQAQNSNVDFYSTRRWNVSYPALQFKLQSISLQSTPGYSINAVTQLEFAGPLSADHLRNEASGVPALLDDGLDKLISPAGMVTATGVVFSAGMIWWAARAGGLMASLALSLPTWRNIDPLSVVGRKKDDPEDWGIDDDKDLERLRDERAVTGMLEDMTEQRR